MSFKFSSNFENALLAATANMYPLELEKEYEHTVHGRNFLITRHPYIHPHWTEIHLTRKNEAGNDIIWNIQYAVTKVNLDVMVGVTQIGGDEDIIKSDLTLFLLFA